MNGAEPVASDRSLIYKITDEVELLLHVFEADRADPADDPAPCILFFFGGGWRAGTPEQFYPHCQYFASRGLVAISAEYRVSWDDPKPFECVTDGRSAMRWLRTHAEDLGIDSDRVAAGGGSAPHKYLINFINYGLYVKFFHPGWGRVSDGRSFFVL